MTRPSFQIRWLYSYKKNKRLHLLNEESASKEELARESQVNDSSDRPTVHFLIIIFDCVVQAALEIFILL